MQLRKTHTKFNFNNYRTYLSKTECFINKRVHVCTFSQHPYLLTQMNLYLTIRGHKRTVQSSLSYMLLNNYIT